MPFSWFGQKSPNQKGETRPKPKFLRFYLLFNYQSLDLQSLNCNKIRTKLQLTSWSVLCESLFSVDNYSILAIIVDSCHLSVWVKGEGVRGPQRTSSKLVITNFGRNYVKVVQKKARAQCSRQCKYEVDSQKTISSLAFVNAGKDNI